MSNERQTASIVALGDEPKLELSGPGLHVGVMDAALEFTTQGVGESRGRFQVQKHG